MESVSRLQVPNFRLHAQYDCFDSMAWYTTARSHAFTRTTFNEMKRILDQSQGEKGDCSPPSHRTTTKGIQRWQGYDNGGGILTSQIECESWVHAHDQFARLRFQAVEWRDGVASLG